MKIEIWSIGKESESFIEQGIQFYTKKAKPFCTMTFICIAPPKRTTAMTIEQMKKDEEKLLLSKLQPHHYLILLDERGKSFNSIEWAEQIESLQNNSVKTIVFLIGGPWGVSDAIKKKAQQIWSLSKLVFPHQLVRLLIAEQIYRSFSILNNSSYHHE